MKHILDFNSVPSLETMPLFCWIGNELEEKAKEYPEFSNRVHVCTKFAWFATSGKDQLCSPDEKVQMMREAFLRACLQEFAELEASIKRDARALKKPKPIEIRKTNRPLLHALRALRNFAIHLKPSQLDSDEVKTSLSFRDEAIEKPMQIWLLSKETTKLLSTHKDLKEYYQETDLKKLQIWFEQAQTKWGVFELVRLGVEEYAEIVLRENSEVT